MIRACGADDVALALLRRKFKKRRFQTIDDIAAPIEELVLIWSASDGVEWVNRSIWIPL